MLNGAAHSLRDKLTLYFETFAGGPLPSAVSSKLFSAGVQIVTAYGSTETGTVAMSMRQDDPSLTGSPRLDPLWVKFFDYCHPRWVPEGNGTYELQLLVRSQS